MGNWGYFTSISAVYSLQLGKKAYFERFVLRIPPEELELPETGECQKAVPRSESRCVEWNWLQNKNGCALRPR